MTMEANAATESPGSADVPILMYHGISRSSSPRFQPYNVTPETFAAQMQVLVDRGYTSVTMSELAALRSSGREVPPLTVAVTVDDGFRDFVDGGLPTLQHLGLKATLYVPTGFVGATSRWLSPEGEGSRAMLTWSELSTVAQAGVECGAHSHTHPQMDRLDRKDMAREIALSKTLLEQHLQRQVTSFAYPYGYSGKATRELVRQLGFTHACSVRDLMSNSLDDAFHLPRITVTPELSPSALGAVLDHHRWPKDDLRSASRAVASRALRASRLKKRTPPSARWEAPPA